LSRPVRTHGSPTARALHLDILPGTDLFQNGFRGTVVGNALPELIDTIDDEAYRSPLPFAAGVLDGIFYWTGTGRTINAHQRERRRSDAGDVARRHSTRGP
jgi:hypothetical protein